MQRRKSPTRPLTLALAAVLLTALASCGETETPPTDSTPATATADTVPPTPTSAIQWIDSTLDFGRIREGETVEARFRFRNTGQYPLVISNVSPSCGCTVAEKPVEPVAPGAEGSIRASFDSKGRLGPNRKTLNVYSNTPEGMHRLAFTVEVLGKD
jgi:hypothetical protein